MLTKLTTAFSWLLSRIFYPIVLLWVGFNWQFLRDIRQNKVVASMGFWLVFVPLAAKAMHEVSDVLVIELGGQVIKLNMTLPFSWQSLFFAALSFSAGNLLVSILGPRIVLDHKDFGSFDSSGKTEAHLREYDERFNALDEQERKRLLHLAGVKISERPEIDLRNKFWKAYAIQNVSAHLLRWICSAFYAVGFVLLCEILYKQVLWVTSSISLSAYLHQLVFWPVLEWLAKWL
jgi:hypothetical protein